MGWPGKSNLQTVSLGLALIATSGSSITIIVIAAVRHRGIMDMIFGGIGLFFLVVTAAVFLFTMRALGGGNSNGDSGKE